MKHTNEQKIKLLVLYDLLCKLTDENHTLNTDEIITLLTEKNITVSRKTLVQDIALLNEYGYEVLSYKKKYHYYYVVNRQFDVAEIALLSDAVQASKLSVSQKQKLTNKLMATIGDIQAKELSSTICCDSIPERNNKHIIYSIDTLKQAIIENRQVSFKYYSLDYQKNKIYHNSGDRYIVDPLAVVWNNDNYYFICYDNKHDGIAHYRIDRMDSAEEELTQRLICKEIAEFDVEKYRQRVFSMFGGDEKEVELQFNSNMIDEIFDKFGEDVNIIKLAEDKFYIKVPIQVSKTFFTWVVGTQGKLHILSPPAVKEQFDVFIQKIKNEY